MDYIQFKKDRDSVLCDIRMECMREMYKRSQPSISYDDILDYYRECRKKNIIPERVFERHYLSHEEFLYVLDKYVEVYKLRDEFRDHCDILVRDMEEGCLKEKWITEKLDEEGRIHPGYRGSEEVPKMKDIIGEENARKVIDFIKMRKEYYKFNRDEERFKFDVSLTDSPTCNEEIVKEYWEKQGKPIEIDPRHKDENYFWEEENGYLEDDEEEEDD